MWLYWIFAIILIIIIILFTLGLQPSDPPATMDPIPANTFPFPIFIINLDRKPERYAYITKQLDSIGLRPMVSPWLEGSPSAQGLTGYTRISGTDGFKADLKDIEAAGVSPILYQKGKGLAGCAASHLRVWKHIVDNDLGWTLILEDDAHFHPDFLKLFSEYWRQVPKNAKIIFVGYCAPYESASSAVLPNNVGCLQGYMLNSEGAFHLLKYLRPITQPIDDAIGWHFRLRNDSYIFNGNARVNGIRPYDYKDTNGRRCMFNGIIYQNQAEQGSTIHGEETVF